MDRQKRVRFPKGKKVKPGDEAAVRRPVVEDEGPSDLNDPRLAAKERANRRSQFTAELFSEDSRGIASDISSAEVAYEVGFFSPPNFEHVLYAFGFQSRLLCGLIDCSIWLGALVVRVYSIRKFLFISKSSLGCGEL